MSLSRATGLLAAVIFLTAYPALRGNKAAPAAAPAAALSPKPPQTLAGPAEIYPNATMTPGDTNPDITQENIGQNICKTGLPAQRATTSWTI